MTLDNHKTIAKYVTPPTNIDLPGLEEEDVHVPVTENWICDHVQVSKYCLQIVACDNEDCCPNRPCEIKQLIRPFFPNGYLPPPAKLRYMFKKDRIPLFFSKKDMCSKDLKFVPLPSRAHFPAKAETPFDSFCPSMQAVLKKSICDQCSRAFPSKAQMLIHRRKLHKFVRVSGVNIDKLLEFESDQQ